MSDALMSECPETGLPIFHDTDENGQPIERRLGLLPPTAEESGLLKASSLADVPPTKWKYVTHEECAARINAFLILFLLNQLSHGSCVGFSAAGALQWILKAINFPLDGKLSGAYIYSWINGQRDQGASIVAALRALEEHGTCFESTVGWDTIYRRQMPSGADAEAQRFKLQSGETVEGAESIISLGQLGHPVQFGIQVSGNFQRFDDEGVCGYGGRGSNHSVFAAPLLVKKQNGQPKVPLINSWGKSFGPFGGWCYVDERHLNGGGGGFVHGTPNYDPNAAPPPVAA